jgi:hypothetical protein
MCSIFEKKRPPQVDGGIGHLELVGLGPDTEFSEEKN